MASAPKATGLLLVSLALCLSVVHGLSAAEPKPVERIQAAFKEVTQLSDNLRVETQKITLFNAAEKGVKITAGFSTIIVKVTEYTARLAGTAYGYDPSPLNDADAKLVVQSLTTFVKVHQALLNVVIGKHGLATLFPFFEPIRVALVNLETVIDTFAFYLIDLIPTQKPAANDQFKNTSACHLSLSKGSLSSVKVAVYHGERRGVDVQQRPRGRELGADPDRNSAGGCDHGRYQGDHGALRQPPQGDRQDQQPERAEAGVQDRPGLRSDHHQSDRCEHGPGSRFRRQPEPARRRRRQAGGEQPHDICAGPPGIAERSDRKARPVDADPVLRAHSSFARAARARGRHVRILPDRSHPHAEAHCHSGGSSFGRHYSLCRRHLQHAPFQDFHGCARH